MATLPKTPLTAQEYLEGERAAETKSEFVDGVVYMMSGVRDPHDAIVAETLIFLGLNLREKNCRVFTSDMRVAVGNRDYFYPDLAVACGKPQFEDDRKDNLTNPVLVIEVLSPSTERYDRTKKTARYRTIPSLAEYLLISQDTCFVEHYLRQTGGQWMHTAYSDLDASVPLAVGVELPLREVYRRVEFEPSTTG